MAATVFQSIGDVVDADDVSASFKSGSNDEYRSTVDEL